MCIHAVIGENVFCGLQVNIRFQIFLASFTVDYVSEVLFDSRTCVQMIHNDIVLRLMISACFKYRYTVMGDVVVTFRNVKFVFILNSKFLIQKFELNSSFVTSSNEPPYAYC